MSAALIARKLADAGLDANAIVAALEAFEAVEEERKAKTRERKRRQRGRESAGQCVTSRDVTGQDVTIRGPSSPSQVSPHTPLPNNPNFLPPSPPKGGSSPTDFDRFWSAYPAKVGKKAAAKAWGRAKDRPALPDLLAALERYRRSKPADRDWCNPATWLNEGRWDDGIEADAPPVATFDGPPELRAKVVEIGGEPFARSYLDPSRWRADDRTLLAANSFAAAKLRTVLANHLTRWKVNVEAVANDSSGQETRGEAA